MKPSIDILLRGEERDGRLALVELDVPVGSAGPPLPMHETWDEGFYVLEGAVTIQTGDKRATVAPGMFAFAARNTPHTFTNLGEKDARVLLVLTPAGFEQCLITGERPPPKTRTVGPPIGE